MEIAYHISCAFRSHPIHLFIFSPSSGTIPRMEKIGLGEKLSHGSQAEVFKAKSGLDDMVVKMFLSPNYEDSKREVEIIKRLHNRHIVQFYYTHQDIVVMEYMGGGSLSQATSRSSIVDWETTTRIAKQV
ncbi:kinase-like domain-containing protein [Dissophora ornata]|nr:kinase-like domain-containing protein [Dissophora ornata]